MTTATTNADQRRAVNAVPSFDTGIGCPTSELRLDATQGAPGAGSSRKEASATARRSHPPGTHRSHRCWKTPQSNHEASEIHHSM